MIETVIFDIGKVLVDFDWELYLEQLGFDQQTRDVLVSAVFRHPDWTEIDRGVLSNEEIISRFITNAGGYEAEIRKLAENLGIPTEGIWSRVNKSLEAVGMTAFRHRSPNKLSGGQKQRVAIAGVMAMQPKCIIMDEPTAMLDPNGRKEVLEAVHELNRQEGITVILITHYMEEVIDSDRVFVMDQGHVVMQGTPREIFSRVEELKAYRLDVPQVTLLAYELKKAGIRLPDGILTIKELVDALCH